MRGAALLRVAFALLAPAVAAAQASTPRQGPMPGTASDVVMTLQANRLSRSPRARELASQNHVLLFPYGQGQPRLVCAPLRACHIELAPGERPLARSGGDLVRWMVTPIQGPGGSWLITAKPMYCDITTDLLVTTDRRIYSLVLDSPPCAGADSVQFNPRLPYTSILRFYYPDEAGAWAAADSAMRAEERARTVVPAEGGSARTGINLDYAVRRDRGFPFVPAHVYDNGEDLFIHLPESAREGDLPVVHEVAADGAVQLIRSTYDTERNVIRVAGLPERVLLVIASGGGGGELRLLVQRGGAR